jgi:hypothetical protein
MDLVTDPEFNPRFKSKPRKTGMPSLRVVGRIASVVLLGGLAIIPTQNVRGRWRNAPKLQRIAITNPNGYQVLPQVWTNPRIAPGSADHFVRSAPEGIDQRFLVSAPTGIDEGIVVNVNQAPGSRTIIVTPPAYPYVAPVPAPPSPSR